MALKTHNLNTLPIKLSYLPFLTQHHLEWTWADILFTWNIRRKYDVN